LAIKLKLSDIEKKQFGGLDPVMVIGFFDGVHKGHQKIINMCKDSSGKKGRASIILTFDRPPLNVVKSRIYKKLILPFKEKLKILEDIGVDFIVTAEISPEFLSFSPGDFCKDILLGIFGVKELFIGKGFRFGYRASGDVGLLKSYLESAGVRVNEVKLLGSDEGEVISSTTIRDYYKEGNILKIRKLLGRDPYIKGMVVKGAGRGEDLGFPTANILTDYAFNLKKGVYGGWALIKSERLPALLYVGTAPTFGGKFLRFEIYIPKFRGYLYGKNMGFEVQSFLREERLFSNKEDIQTQLEIDREVLLENSSYEVQ